MWRRWVGVWGCGSTINNRRQRLRCNEVTHGQSQKGSPEDFKSMACHMCMYMYMCVCVCVFKNFSLGLLVNSFFYFTIENEVGALWLCSKRGWRREQTIRKRHAQPGCWKEKKEPCPVAGTQTGWFGWGMVSQKHLREADVVTIATRQPDRQHVLSLLWLMPAARLALAMARHTQSLRVWQDTELNWHILCTDKWAGVQKPDKPHMVLSIKLWLTKMITCLQWFCTVLFLQSVCLRVLINTDEIFFLAIKMLYCRTIML